MADSGNLTILVNSGFDAFQNLWDINIKFPEQVSSNLSIDANSLTKELTIRTKDFTPPDPKLETYEIDYKGITIQRPGAWIDFKRTFDLTFRLDSGYNILQAFQTWKRLYFNPSGDGEILFGAFSNDTSFTNDYYGSIQVHAYKATGNLSSLVNTENTSTVYGAEWTFSQVMLTDVKLGPYARSETNPQTITCSFLYGSFKEPYATSKDSY